MNSHVIRSSNNPRIKAVAKLRRGRTARRQGLLIIDGVREASLALAANIEILQALYAPGSLSDAAAELVSQLPASTEKLELATSVLAKVAYGERQDGLVLVGRRPHRTLAELRLSENPLVIVLENVEKPGNLGAVVRTADAVAADAILLCGDKSVDPFHANVIRASSGVIFQMPVVAAAAEEAVLWLKDRQIQRVVTRPDARQLYTDISLAEPTAIVLGSEAEGLTPFWSDSVGTAVKLPMLGQADSLNVSNTAAILLFESLRQRSLSPR